MRGQIAVIFISSLAIGWAGWRCAWGFDLPTEVERSFFRGTESGDVSLRVVGRGENCDRRRRPHRVVRQGAAVHSALRWRRGVLLEGGMRALLAKSQRLACLI